MEGIPLDISDPYLDLCFSPDLKLLGALSFPFERINRSLARLLAECLGAKLIPTL
jgi:hypothetical protein